MSITVATFAGIMLSMSVPFPGIRSAVVSVPSSGQMRTGAEGVALGRIEYAC